MSLRWPLSRGSQFKFHFYLGWRENRGSHQSFHVTSFEGSLINNTKLWDNLTGTKGMAIPIGPKGLWQNGKTKVRMFWDYLVNHLYSKKINLKKPLSRGSRFKIYFRLECWENRGSHQNFHEIPFFKDHTLINPDHFVTYNSTITCLFKKLHNFHLNMEAKKT